MTTLRRTQRYRLLNYPSSRRKPGPSVCSLPWQKHSLHLRFRTLGPGVRRDDDFKGGFLLCTCPSSRYKPRPSVTAFSITRHPGESRDPASALCPGKSTPRTFCSAPWVPACAGMTTLRRTQRYPLCTPRHPGESRDPAFALCPGKSTPRTFCSVPWVPACAGMTTLRRTQRYRLLNYPSSRRKPG